MEVEQSASNPWTLYLYVMKSPITMDKYQKRLGKFFDFLGLEGTTIQEKSRVFVEMAIKDNNWSFNSILRFVQSKIIIILIFQSSIKPSTYEYSTRGRKRKRR